MKTIIALVPGYDENGHYIECIFREGSEKVRCQMRTQLDRIFRERMWDMKAVRMTVCRLLDLRVLPPLVLGGGSVDCYIPLPMRPPRVKKDPGVGYLLLSAVRAYEWGKITLDGGRTVSVRADKGKIEREMLRGRLAVLAMAHRETLIQGRQYCERSLV